MGIYVFLDKGEREQASEISKEIGNVLVAEEEQNRRGRSMFARQPGNNRTR